MTPFVLIYKTTKGNLEVLHEEVAFFWKQTCQARIKVGPTKFIMQPTMCVVDVEAGSNLVNNSWLRPKWGKQVPQLPVPGTWTCTDQRISVFEDSLLLVRMGSLQFRTWLIAIEHSAVNILLVTKHINPGIQSIFPYRRKLGPCTHIQASILSVRNGLGGNANILYRSPPDDTEDRAPVSYWQERQIYRPK